MYEVVKNVIGARNYELGDMLGKIDKLWVQGSLSDEKREELLTLARRNAQVGNSVDMLAKLEELDKRVKVLEAALLGGGSSGDDTSEATYPEYEGGKWYYNGDIVSFEGATYQCIAPDGVVCVWSPSGYPDYWEVYTGDAVEEPVTDEPVEEETEAEDGEL